MLEESLETILLRYDEVQTLRLETSQCTLVYREQGLLTIMKHIMNILKPGECKVRQWPVNIKSSSPDKLCIIYASIMDVNT